MVAAIVVLFSWIFLGLLRRGFFVVFLRLVRVFWCGGFVAICVFVLGWLVLGSRILSCEDCVIAFARCGFRRCLF